VILQRKVKVEEEAKAVVEADSTSIGSHIHIKVQKAKEKVQKEKAKEKASIPVTTLVMVQKAVQRVQASIVQKVAVSLQLHVIHVVREVTLQISAGTAIKLNLWFSKFSKIKCTISKYILHHSFQVLALQQSINFSQV
jgi:hypothetical protein